MIVGEGLHVVEESGEAVNGSVFCLCKASLGALLFGPEDRNVDCEGKGRQPSAKENFGKNGAPHYEDFDRSW